MAPIPEDNQEKPPSRDDEISAFSSGNTATITFSSEDSDDDDDNYPDTSGYMLLPQEPGVDNDNDSDNEIIDYSSNPHSHTQTIQDQVSEHTDGPGDSEMIDTFGVMGVADDIDVINTDHLPNEVIQSEGGATAPTVSALGLTHHLEFLAKFADGKIPSYMQVPDIPSKPNSNNILWNKRRPEKSSCLTTEDNKILKAMSGFSLPMENVPDWAKNLSDDQWNDVISQQIGTEPTDTQLKHGNSHQQSQAKQTSDSSLGSEGQTKQVGSDWVAEFPDS